jgi:hypothetical protein
MTIGRTAAENQMWLDQVCEELKLRDLHLKMELYKIIALY